jgi:PPOX class probable F420-dependent enzyme
MVNEPPQWARDFLDTARVGHLATASAAAQPHVVAVCFAFVGDQIFTPIDEKPKSGRVLTRVRNIRASPMAALVVDRYDEDWTQLAWVQVRGSARVVRPDDPLHPGAVEALREKYPQYHAMALERCEVIELKIEQWRAWRWTSE